MLRPFAFRIRGFALLPLCLALLAPPRADAQALPDSVPPFEVRRGPVDDLVFQVMGGLAGGVAGAAVGGVLGVALETALTQCSGVDWCGFGGALLGVLAGESVGVPIGVHLASAKPGKLAGPILYSFAATAGGLLLATPTRGKSILFIPPIQIYLSMKLR